LQTNTIALRTQNLDAQTTSIAKADVLFAKQTLSHVG
jgi:hypothetical protein